MWALSRNPDLQIVLVSYSDELAQAHSREARQLINEFSDVLGIRLSADKTAVGRWQVDGHAGGCWPPESTAASPVSALT